MDMWGMRPLRVMVSDARHPHSLTPPPHANLHMTEPAVAEATGEYNNRETGPEQSECVCITKA